MRRDLATRWGGTEHDSYIPPSLHPHPHHLLISFYDLGITTLIQVVYIFEEPGHSSSYKIVCALSELRSGCTSVQFDQSLQGTLWIAKDPSVFRRIDPWLSTAKTLIRLCGCQGCSESSLGAHVILLENAMPRFILPSYIIYTMAFQDL